MVEVKVTLYHMLDCQHCVAFMPEWNNFKQMVLDGKYNRELIKSLEVDTIESEEVTDNDKVNGKKVELFPTIKIEVVQKKDINYSGDRTADALMKYIENEAKEDDGKLSRNKQKGGGPMMPGAFMVPSPIGDARPPLMFGGPGGLASPSMMLGNTGMPAMMAPAMFGAPSAALSNPSILNNPTVMGNPYGTMVGSTSVLDAPSAMFAAVDDGCSKCRKYKKKYHKYKDMYAKLAKKYKDRRE